MLIPIWVSKHKSTILLSLYSLLLLELFLNWKSRMIFFPFFSFWLLSSYQRAVQHRGPVGQPVPRMHSAMTSTLASIQVAQRPSHPLTKLKFFVCVFFRMLAPSKGNAALTASESRIVGQGQLHTKRYKLFGCAAANAVGGPERHRLLILTP